LYTLARNPSIPFTVLELKNVSPAVLFKLRPETTAADKAKLVSELKSLKFLPSVQDHQLLVGGPSVTDPIERSQGFEYALLSYHRNLEALAEYHASDEHHR
jgi:hypothetical protein